MDSLATCGVCRGFVPPHADACPHCAAPSSPPEPTVAGKRGPLGALAATAFSMVLMACYGQPYDPVATCPDGPDNDNDGHHQTGSLGAGGSGGGTGETCEPSPDQDCDDTDPNTYPGAPDPMDGQLLDTNCDGRDGVQCEERDDDADGWSIWIDNGDCWLPVGHDNHDCDDSDPNVGGPCST